MSEGYKARKIMKRKEIIIENKVVQFTKILLSNSILLPENVATSIVEKRLKLATRKNERNEKEIQFSIQSTGCH